MRPASAHAHAPTKDHIQRSTHSFWILNELLEIETARFLFQQSLTNFLSNWEYIQYPYSYDCPKKNCHFISLEYGSFRHGIFYSMKLVHTKTNYSFND